MRKELQIASLGFMTLLGSCGNPLGSGKQVTTEAPAAWRTQFKDIYDLPFYPKAGQE